jgi:hypothetical protein
MTALETIVAKITVVVDFMLGQYVSVETYSTNSACGSGLVYNYTLTNCGEPLIHSLESLLTSVLQLYSYILPAFGTYYGGA